MSAIAGMIRPGPCQEIKAMLAKEKGKELYLLGHLDPDGKIEEIRLIGKVTQKTLLALFSTPQTGEIVIRTQADPKLLPTDDDEMLVKRFQDKGVGYYLLSHAFDKLVVLVEPPKESEEVQLLDEDDVAALLGPEGPLAKKLPGYEERDEQIEMLRRVVRSFNGDQLLMVEAGTGTGKSLAYLIPSIVWAKTNKEKIVISTGTINLQEQIMTKDVPFLQKTLGISFEAALVKGRNHYLCLRKLNHVQNEPTLFEDSGEPGSWGRLLRWAKKTTTGDRAEMPFLPHDQQWGSLQTDSESCQKTRCEFYRSCFYYMAKRDQGEADLLVTNHHVLFADLAIRDSLDNYGVTALLPPYRRVVVDEAHNLEDAASGFLGLQVTPQGILQSLGMLATYNRRGEEIGLLRQIGLFLLERGSQIPDATAMRQKVYEDFLPAVKALRGKTQGIKASIQALLEVVWKDADKKDSHTPKGRGEDKDARDARDTKDAKDAKGRGPIKQRITAALVREGIWEKICGIGLLWAEEIRGLLKELLAWGRQFEKQAQGIETRALHFMMDFSAAISRLGSACEMLTGFFHADPLGKGEDGLLLVRWIEIQPDGEICRFQAAPLEIGTDLERMLYTPISSVVFASATMATGPDDFSYIVDRLGLSRQDEGRLQTATFASPFDYKAQSLIAIPTDLPSPKEDTFDAAITHYIFEALCASDGRAFVLCTSFQLLRHLYDSLAPRLLELGIASLGQGQIPRTALLQKKIQDPRSVLFGTDSFWEGVDVRGEALCNVILTRLPFRVPSDPLIEARLETLEARGENPFLRYTVPAATIKFKQGFGRLIRSREDTGTVVILDKRVVEKPYGRQFLKALPQECPRVIASAKQTLQTLRQFHQGLAEKRRM